jgi:hypothetical protein
VDIRRFTCVTSAQALGVGAQRAETAADEMALAEGEKTREHPHNCSLINSIVASAAAAECSLV